MKRVIINNEAAEPSNCCNSCSSDQPNKLFLHNLRHRGNFLRLCTSCVLKHHSGSFCPHCFDIYKGLSPPESLICCTQCGFSSHFDCVGEDVVVSSYVCPTCENPSFSFFDCVVVVGNNKKRRNGDECVNGVGGVIDLRLSKVLLAAAHFAAVSMSKAAGHAKAVAEERGKEAAYARKKAKEAIERVYYLAKAAEKGNGGVKSVEERVGGGEGGGLRVAKKKCVGGSSEVAAAVAAQKQFQKQAGVVVEGGSGKVGEGRVKGGDVNVSGGVRKMPINGVAAPVGNARKVNGGLEHVKGGKHPQKHVAVNDVVRGGNEKKGIQSGTHATGKAQHSRNSPPTKGGREKVKELSNSKMVPELNHLKEGSADALVSRSKDGVSQAGLSKMS